MKIAIIPARGGSKRIPKKNIKIFHGKPIIAYSIEAAVTSGCFDKIIVSTDDIEISNVAKKYGAEVPFLRPSEISNDYATTVDVIEHALRWCKAQSWNVDAICCLYATAPFVLASDLQKGYELLQEKDVEYTFSVTSFPFPIQRAVKVDDCNSIQMFWPENENKRSQDLEDSYHDAGQFYWGRPSAFLNKLPIFSSNSKAVLLPRNRVQDIDTNEDWDLAESLFSNLIACKNQSR